MKWQEYKAPAWAVKIIEEREAVKRELKTIPQIREMLSYGPDDERGVQLWIEYKKSAPKYMIRKVDILSGFMGAAKDYLFKRWEMENMDKIGKMIAEMDYDEVKGLIRVRLAETVIDEMILKAGQQFKKMIGAD